MFGAGPSTLGRVEMRGILGKQHHWRATGRLGLRIFQQYRFQYIAAVDGQAQQIAADCDALTSGCGTATGLLLRSGARGRISWP